MGIRSKGWVWMHSKSVGNGLGQPLRLTPSSPTMNPMRLSIATLLLTLAGCASSESSSPSATRASCGRTPEPLNADTCFGEHLKTRVQTTDPRAANYVPPSCPCAAFANPFFSRCDLTDACDGGTAFDDGYCCR